MTDQPAAKKDLGTLARGLRLVLSVLDPRAYLHALKLINYYNYSHVTPRRRLARLGPGARISPNASFSNPERIEIGARLRLGAHCTLMAGPSRGRIVIGDDVLFGPGVLITAANYRFNEGSPVTKQRMDEADVIIGRDVWLGANVMVLPGVTIGEGAIIAAGSVLRADVPEAAIVAGVPGKVVGQRQISL